MNVGCGSGTYPSFALWGVTTGLSGTSSPSSTRSGDFVWDSWMSEMEGMLNDPMKSETVNELLCMILKDEGLLFFLIMKGFSF